MAFNREFELNEAQLEDFLKNATEKVKTSENVDLLSDLNKLFKKNVPLTVRKYVIAYLLKEALKHYHSFGNRRDRFERNERVDRNDRNQRYNRQERNFRQEYHQERTEAPAETTETAAAEEERPRHPRVEIPEDQATSIFISIGKNRRVYPRDLVGILIAIAGIDRERIGDIKVLANYSFVQLYTEDAQTAIDKLNGYDYRGRKLAVSYSRQKSDADAAEAEAQSEEAEMAAEDAAAYAAAEKAAADKEPFGV
ncbi:MAG: DbpA RNA binding domain-containing protein [Treponema sp.]|nr:DbpA RNA binding domain-containing protein [Treponema sp.]MDY5757893.1 DbpA RNA binding domain-containing protein [Treponema sp.]